MTLNCDKPNPTVRCCGRSVPCISYSGQAKTSRRQLPPKTRAGDMRVAAFIGNSARATSLPKPDALRFQNFHPRFNTRLQFGNHHWNLSHAV
jgi:hypothetical protein